MTSAAGPAHEGITVGIDGSGGDRIAIAWGVRTAVALHLPVCLVHAHRASDPAVSDRIASAEHLARSAAPDAIVRTVTTIGSAVEVLLHESTKSRMLVLAPHTGEPLDGFGWQTTTMVAAAADCPVIAVPRTARSVPEHGPVVVGVDGSPAGEPALAFAFAHAAAVGAELTAVHSWDDGAGEIAAPGLEGIGLEPVVDLEQRVLAERLAGWRQRYPDVAVRREVAHGRAARALATHAETARLLVVGSSGRAGLSGLLAGSTSQALLYELPCPLAIVRGEPG